MPDAPHRPPQLVSRQLTLALLTIGGLLAQRLPLPWSVAGVVFLIPAVVVGVLLVRALVRAKVGGLAMLGTAVTLGLAALTLLLTTGRLALYPVTSGYEQCLAAAITEQAKAVCEEQRVRQTEELFSPGSRP